MFNATYFSYDGKWSGQYGLQIVDFDTNPVQETDALSPTLSVIKAPGSLRFFHGGIEYDSAPTFEFSIVSEMEFTGTLRRRILSWLVGKKEFRPLTFDGGDNEGITYYCVFTSVKTIWVHGRCHGFRLTAQFDSPYARGIPTSVSVSGNSTVTIHNMSDIADGYVYPIVEFSGSYVDIVNTTDDPNRHFTFSGLSAAETVVVDNETRCISSALPGEKLSNFMSKNWLRLRPGKNTLTINTAGNVKITCPRYIMIGY